MDIGVRSLRWKQSATNTGRSIDIVGLRRKADVGQRDLAMLLDIAPQRLSDLERGYAPIPQGFEQQVRQALQEILQQRMNAVGMQ